MKLLLALLFFMLTAYVQAFGWEESPEVDELFNNAAVNGTFVLYDVTAQKYVGHNEARSGVRFLPASTFKIPNSLIGLSVGAVRSVDEVLPYKGPSQPFIKAWAKDMGLREAISLSNVPIYQELARRIGLDRMRENIVRMDYGNKEVGTSVDSFWLSGPLKISAVEQALFLAKLAQGTLPFPPEAQKSVREITLLEQGDDWKLYGKTGWQNAPGQGVGWWVGWVEKDGHIYAYALNIDILNETNKNKRVKLGKSSLKALGIMQ